jgi:hypothetical protein
MTPRQIKIWKKVLFPAVSVLLVFTAADIAIQFMYRVTHGFFTWETVEHFNIREFTIRTDDTRYVTGRPSYSYQNNEQGKPWRISLDEHGFRQGSHHSSLTENNIVFLGDSVPFGWGVPGEHSVASWLHRFMEQSTGLRPILNAALPSYSLDQAISRYAFEIHGRFPVGTVILQVIDPIGQFTMLGRGWHTDRNWTTRRRWAGHTAFILNRETIFPLGNSSLLYLWKRAFHSSETEQLVADDAVAFRIFRSEIQESLVRLHDLLHSQEDRLILLPAVSPESTVAAFSVARREATSVFNEELASFAARHSDVQFISLSEIVANPENDLFLDRCCHLTSKGAGLQARIIGSAISNEDGWTMQ